jgi:hypothetical protein
MVLALSYKTREFKSILNISVKKFGMGRMKEIEEKKKQRKEITRRFNYSTWSFP